MNLKEFFMPTKGKISLTILFTLIFEGYFALKMWSIRTFCDCMPNTICYCPQGPELFLNFLINSIIYATIVAYISSCIILEAYNKFKGKKK